MESQELLVRQKGLIKGATIGYKFHFGFEPGHILFGSRNPHLKKCSMVDFAGVCFDSTYVVETRDPEVLDQRYLLLEMQSDRFWDWAEENKSGSVNYLINYCTLDEYEFDLPPIEKQRELADLLWAANDLKEAYRKAIAATDEMLKAKFREMFGDVGNDRNQDGTVKQKSIGKWPMAKVSSFMSNLRNGLSPSRRGECQEKVLTLTAITQGSFLSDEWKEGAFDSVPPDEKRVSTKDFYICRGNGNKSLVGVGVFSAREHHDLVFPDTVIAGTVDENKVALGYLFYAWKMPFMRRQIDDGARTTNGIYKINQQVIQNLQIPLPPLSLQREFVAIAEKADETKSSLKKSIADLDAVMKGLING